MPPRSSHRGIIAFIALLCALIAPSRTALAQEGGGGTGHGWFVIETLTKEKTSKAMILHLPPVDRLSPRGSVRVVQGLNRAPERLAWSGSELYILMPAERVAAPPSAAGETATRRVYTIAATPGLMSGWEYVPPDLPESMASIDGEWGAKDLDVIGWAAAPGVPAALVRHGPTGPPILIVLAGTSWVRATLPWEGEKPVAPAPTLSDRCRLLTAGNSIGVLVERVGQSDVGWYVALPEDVGAIPAKAKSVSLHWTTREVYADPPSRAGRGEVYCVENQLMRVTPEGDAAVISVLHASRETVVATIADPGEDVRLSPVEGRTGFLAMLGRTSAGKSAAAGAEATYQLTEITPSGRLLYKDPAKQDGPVSLRDMQVLAVLLVMIMAAVVVFVLRPDKSMPSNAIALPTGWIPAENGRRIMAAVLDLGAAWIVGSLLVRIDLGDLARPDVLLGTPRGWLAGGAAVGTTIVLGVLMEWQFGITVGKLLLGCRVLTVKRRSPEEAPAAEGAPAEPQAVGVEGISFTAAVIRNLGKWTPWNIVEFLATGRQRPWADRLSGTMVAAADGSEQEGEG